MFEIWEIYPDGEEFFHGYDADIREAERRCQHISDLYGVRVQLRFPPYRNPAVRWVHKR